MQTRREMLARSASVAAALAGLGLLPQAAQAAWSQAAFDAKTMGDLMKALGTSGPTESKEVTITGPDIAENGAVVPVGASTTLAGAKRIALLVEKNPAMLAAIFDITDAVEPSISTGGGGWPLFRGTSPTRPVSRSDIRRLPGVSTPGPMRQMTFRRGATVGPGPFEVGQHGG